jgi:hypothetical protein
MVCILIMIGWNCSQNRDKIVRTVRNFEFRSSRLPSVSLISNEQFNQ